MRKIEKLNIILWIAISFLLLSSVKVNATEYVRILTSSQIIMGVNQTPSLVPIATKWANEDLSIFVGPNELTKALGSIKRDSKIKIHHELTNGWASVLIEDKFGFVDARKLRDTEIRAIEPEPEAVESQEIKEPMATRMIPAPKEVEATKEMEATKKMTFKLSFYTNFLSENGGYTKTASGSDLFYGVIASNVYPLGTKIYLEGYGEMTVLDRGGKHFNNKDRLDVYIPQNDGESREQYKKRVLALGRKTAVGYIID